MSREVSGTLTDAHTHPRLTSAWLSAAAVVLMCTLPFLQWRHASPLTSFYSEWLAFVLGCAALFPLALTRYAKPLSVPWIALASLAFAVVVAMHLVFMRSPYPQQPALAAVYLLWASGLIVLAAILKRELGFERVVVLLAWSFLGGGVLNSIAGILQHYEWRGVLETVIATQLGKQVYGNLAQANHYADYLSIAIVSLVFLQSTGRISRATAVLTCTPMLFTLSLSGSRSAWLYLGALAIIAMAAHRLATTKESRSAMLFALALLPGFVVVQFVADLPWFAAPTLHTTVLDRMFDLAATPSQRWQLWREAWLMFAQSPFFGSGWGTFAWHYFEYGGALSGITLTGLFNNAHNIVLQLLAETGAIGACIVIAGAVLWMRNVWRAVARPAGAWLLASMAVIGIHSLLEYPLWNAYFLGVASILLGLGETRFAQLAHTNLLRLGTAVFMVCGLAVAVLLLEQYYRLETVLNAMYGDRAGQEMLDRSHREMMSARSSFFLAPYVDLAYARDIELNTENLDRKLAFTSRVMQFTPTGMVAYRYAALLALDDRRDDAMRVLHHAIALYPTLLADFAREFDHTQTGSPEAQAWFVEVLRGQVSRQALHNAISAE